MSKATVVREACHEWAGEVAQALKEKVGDRPHRHAGQLESKHQFVTNPELLVVNVTIRVTRNGAYKVTYTSGQERHWVVNEAKRHWTYSKSIASGATTTALQRLIELGLDRAVNEVIREGRANTLYHNLKTQLNGPRGGLFVQLLDKEIWKGQTIDYEVMTWAQIQQWEAWLEKYYKGELAQETPAIENEAQKFEAENPDKPTIPVEPIGPPAQPVEILRRGDNGMEVTPAYFAMNPLGREEVAQASIDEYEQARLSDEVAQALWDNYDDPYEALREGLIAAHNRVQPGKTYDWRRVQNQIKSTLSVKRYSKFRADDHILPIERANSAGQICNMMRRDQNREAGWEEDTYPVVHVARESMEDIVENYCGVAGDGKGYIGLKQLTEVGPPTFCRICKDCTAVVEMEAQYANES